MGATYTVTLTESEMRLIWSALGEAQGEIRDANPSDLGGWQAQANLIKRLRDLRPKFDHYKAQAS